MVKNLTIYLLLIISFLAFLLHPAVSEEQYEYVLQRSWPAGGVGFNDPHDVAVDVSGNMYVVDTSNHRIQKFGPDGEFLAKWGWTKESSPEDRLQFPNNVAVDSSGDVYVVDSGNQRISVYRRTTVTVAQPKPADRTTVVDSEVEETEPPDLSMTDEGDSEVVSDVAIEQPADDTIADTIIIEEQIRLEISMMDSKTKNFMPFSEGQDEDIYLTSWTMGAGYPYTVAVDAAGNVVYVSDSNHRIRKFDLAGRLLATFGEKGTGDGQLDMPIDMALDTSGNIYVADSNNHRIQKFDSEGKFLTKWGEWGTDDGQFNQPNGVALDASGNIYVTDSNNHRIQKFDSEGKFLSKWGTQGKNNGQFSFPADVALDASGNIYVADTNNHRVQKFDSQGKFLTKWGEWGTDVRQFNRPKGLTVDTAGNVYVVDKYNHRIQKFDTKGTFIAEWATAGADGQKISSPLDIAVDMSGRVYVTDIGNRCVRIYSSRAFVPEVAVSSEATGKVELVISQTKIDDASMGNGNGEVESDEIVMLKVTVKNQGTGVAKNVIVKLLYTGTGIDLGRTPLCYLRDMQPGASNVGTFILSILPDHAGGEAVFQIELSEEQGFRSSEEFRLQVKDTRAPEIAIHEPIDNAKIEALSVQLKADITDNGMIANFSVKVNDNVVRSETPEEATVPVDTAIPLEQGDNIILIEASDAAGNKSEKSVRVHMTPPTSELIIAQTQMDDANLGNGSGEVETGESVEYSVTIENNGSGVAKNVSARLVYAGKQVVITPPLLSFGDVGAGVSSEGIFTLSIPSTYNSEIVAFQIELSDEQGNKLSQDVTLQVKDITRPEISVDEPGDNAEIVALSVPLKADITDNITIISYSIKVNDNIVKSDTPGQAAVSIDTDIPLEEGNNAILIEVSDSAGNKGQKTVVVHMTPPTSELVIAQPQVDDTSFGNGNKDMETGETVEFKVTVKNQGTGMAKNVSAKLVYAGADIQIATPLLRLRDIQPGASNVGSFVVSISPNHAGGAATFQIELYDEGILKLSQEFKVQVKDIMQPEISIREPANNAKIDSKSVQLKADITDNASVASFSVKVNDAIIKSGTPGEATVPADMLVLLDQVDNIILIEASDSAGNKSQKSVTVQRMSPQLMISYISPPDSVRQGGIIEFSLFIMNSGTGTAKAVRVSISSEELQIYLMDMPGDLAPGKKKTVTISMTIPDEVKQSDVHFTATAVDTNEYKSNEAIHTAQVMKADTKRPVIAVIEPAVRGMKKITHEAKIMKVVVKATDESGIFKVTVNGQEAQPRINDEYETEISFGNTESDIIISVVAEDTQGNKATLSFDVHYEPPLEFILGDYYALIIAVQDYTDESVNDLDYPIQDAESVKEILITQYIFEEKNVDFLKNPDRTTIIKALNTLEEKLTEQDNLLIFYAGHGSWDERKRQGYWLPRDASSGDTSGWISNSTIRDHVRGLETKHTLLITDACFSGAIFTTREAFLKPDFAIRKMYGLPSRKAITSGVKESVPDKSVFVEYLVKRLAGNQERCLSAEELLVSMKKAVINNSPTHQTPLYGVIDGSGDEGGDFIFVRK